MEQLKNIALGVLLGIRDSLFGIAAIRYLRNNECNTGDDHQRGVKRRKPPNNAFRRIFECGCLNGGLFLASIVAFQNVFLPSVYTFMEFLFGSSPGLLKSVWYWLQPLLSYTFGALWILPLFLLTRIVNALWFQDIADSAYKGRPQSLRSISKLVADTLFSLVIQALFILQSLLVASLPLSFLGQCFSLFHLSLLYSLYSFEYKWFNMGMC
ncbi:etoposide-induced protein 2.4-like protein [Dinothrombium tinctorium]|uniref:Etoposide-induced protein 2.4-like protein n=1 Tax=Dinothrombium tinctorium TaxID=1965070 RepID=A0A443R7X7_9ACAR|nr:etoposide-induced protein 2.4-like protein [Dinothrombium tinctorium]